MEKIKLTTEIKDKTIESIYGIFKICEKQHCKGKELDKIVVDIYEKYWNIDKITIRCLATYFNKAYKKGNKDYSAFGNRIQADIKNGNHLYADILDTLYEIVNANSPDDLIGDYFFYDNNENDTKKIKTQQKSGTKKNSEELSPSSYFDDEGKFDSYSYMTDLLKNLEIIHIEKIGFYQYNGKYWKQVEKDYIGNIIHTGLKSYSKPRYVSEVVRSMELHTYKPIDIVNKNRNRLVLNNGTIDLGNWKEPLFYENQFFKDDYSTIQFSTNYNQGAKCPMFLEYLNKVFLGRSDLIQLIQEYLGYCLTTSVKYEVCIILIGVAGSGKSVLIDIFQKLIGEENLTAIPFSQLNNANSVAQLKDKVLNICTEQENTPIKDLNVFKQIVSGDPVNGKFLYHEPFTFKPFAKLIFAMNQLPNIQNFDDSNKRRLILIPFKHKFEVHERDFSLKEGKLHTELDGIFYWALQGLIRLASRDGTPQQGFIVPDDCKVLLDEYQLICNPIDQYFNERLEKQSEDVFTPSKLIYQDYQKWCSNKGLKFENDVYFGKKIKEKFGDIKQYTRSGNVYKGIKLVS